jgi:serine/threonine-protein kinase
VGQGGFSTVFLVEDTIVYEEVILKILNPQVALDSNMIKRFIHELRCARKVTHENVIRIYDFTTLGASYAISMEYFPGHSLDKELQDGKPLNTKRGLKILWDVCRGIGAAHQVDVVHRDLKPPNILINDQGVVKIVDFGVAAVTSDMSTRLTRVGTLIGTPTYMAPEQVRSRDIDTRTDIYSLGVIMYEIFTGRPPYVGDDMAVLFQHVEGNPVPPRQVNPDLPPGLEEIILKAMAVDPGQRFQSFDELRKNLIVFLKQK